MSVTDIMIAKMNLKPIKLKCMKKFFTLIAVALAATSVNAQEIWNADDAVSRSYDSENRLIVQCPGAVQSTVSEGIYSAGTADGPDTSQPGTLTSETITGETASMKISVVSTPNNLSKKDVEDGKTLEFWSVKGGEGSNEALTTDDCDPKLLTAVMPKGNPTFVYWDYYELNSSGDEVFRVGNTDDIYWTEGKDMPVKGAYILIEPKAAGNLTLGIYVNKGNHPVYVVDAATKTILPASSINVKFYYQNTGFAYYQEKETNDFGEEVVVSEKFINEGTMPDDYIIQHTNGETQNRPALGYMTFPVEAGKTYYAFNPKSQLGCYGFQFTAGSDGISDIAADKAALSDKIFNLAGQQVSNGFRGIVIKNGKKIMQ